MKLRQRCPLKWDATLDVIGRTHHTMAGMVLTRIAVAIYTQRPPNGLTRKPPRGSYPVPSQHLAKTGLAPSLNVSCTWLTPDLDVDSTGPGQHLSNPSGPTGGGVA